LSLGSFPFRLRLDSSVVALGAVSALAQVTALREAFADSGGQEMGMAVALAAWLLLSAAGAAAGGLFPERVAAKLLPVGWAAGAVGLAGLPLLLRGGRALLFAHPGDALGLGRTILYSLVVMAPAALVAGAMCPLAVAARRGACPETPPRDHTRRVYLLDAAGAFAGGVAAALLWWAAPRWPALAGLRVTPLLWALAAVCMVLAPLAARRPGRPAAVAPALLAAALLAMIASRGRVVDDWTLRLRYPDLPAAQDVAAGRAAADVMETESGQALAIRDGAWQRLYVSGGLIYDSDDVFAAAERAGLPALCAARQGLPRRVALLDGPALRYSGALRRFVSAPPVLIATDPALLAWERRGGPARAWKAGAALVDGQGLRPSEALRLGLRQAGHEAWDLILLGGGPPETVSACRCFTLEAMAEFRKLLAPGGVLSFALPASRNLTDPSLARYLAVVIRAAGAAFPHVKVFPSMYAGNLVCASDQPLPSGRDLARRCKALGVDSPQMPAEFLASLDTSLHAADLRRALDAAGRVPVSTASFPAAPLYACLAREARLEGGGGAPWLLRLRTGHLLAALGAALIVALAAVRLAPAAAAAPLAALGAVAVSGFVNMAWAAILILAVQAASGQLYVMSGALVAGFMLGLMAGAAWPPGREASGRRALIAPLLAMAAVSLAAWPALEWALRAGTAGRMLAPPLINAVFGLATARVFVAACHAPGRASAGGLFAADLAGPAAGGFVGGAALLPLLGAPAMAGLCATACCMAGLVVAAARRGGANEGILEGAESPR